MTQIDGQPVWVPERVWQVEGVTAEPVSTPELVSVEIRRLRRGRAVVVVRTTDGRRLWLRGSSDQMPWPSDVDDTRVES
jgi:hypothetical protein